MSESWYEHLDYITKFSYNLSSYNTDVLCILMCPHLAKLGHNPNRNFLAIC